MANLLPINLKTARTLPTEGICPDLRQKSLTFGSKVEFNLHLLSFYDFKFLAKKIYYTLIKINVERCNSVNSITFFSIEDDCGLHS